MTPAELVLGRQEELQQRRLGMRSLVPAESARHFARAAELRSLIAASLGPRAISGITGTKGSSPPRPV